ncbi:poly-beta-1,6-N-acetyl-D-glucosamine N-deacetylase PgaB [Lysobacter pythonis]|uniref:Poly-beta-1,6-N-acetyl-D-glucosamine N-deacetylase PgaB n=1 Tax=Solilutibacter pythonis TaxID=2483112 RepID=A0A3M2HSL8_9GAMM|nr:poly-beta-1,6-N-acetyl-D-glucosamine N-deacetylase PgaB [Lysobacter pythonis]RMH90823.1 poly-beta-1,6-N-acetyl-D-glucosamine N-deacetylase PgaB [Lysobacter pythonis]
MKRWMIVIFLPCLLLLAGHAIARDSPPAGNEPLLVLSYHDIRDEVPPGDGDAYATSTQNFAAHLDWLAGHGYTAVSLSEVVAHVRDGTPLPTKPVLLSFDDGLRSLYTRAWPLLRAYNFPAMAAVVTRWLDMPAGQMVDYGPRPFGKEDFVTWEQVREMQSSGLMEIASHSHDLHHGVQANPQGNQTPAAITRIYNPKTHRYETEAEFRARLLDDLSTSARRIREETGQSPRALVWPYAAYNRIGNDIAGAAGMPVTFDLQESNPAKLTELHGLGRVLVVGNPTMPALANELRRDQALDTIRAMQVDLDNVYDRDPVQQARNLDALIERVSRIRPSHVFLQAFADPDGNGAADAVYFPNRHLPMRADLFSRVAWQLKTRAGVKVYAWLPVIAYQLPDRDWQARHQIAAGAEEIPRLDFTRPEVARTIRDIYEDLAVASYFEGVLFHDDAYLRDGELPQLRDGERTDALIDLTLQLRNAAERWRPKLKTVRNLYARTVLHPESEAWFAQRLDRFMQAYDYTALMAMPYMEGSRHPERWLLDLVAAVKREDPRLTHTIFELQTHDWRTRQPIPGNTLRAHARMLVAAGVRNLAWYPDDFIANQPRLEDARAAFSARAFPYKGP